MVISGVSFQITDQEFAQFKALVYKIAGINLNDTKKMLLVSRLSKRLRVLGMTTFQEYYDYVVSPRGYDTELGEVINLITTNKTDFFRENHHFQMLASTILPELVERCQKRVQKNIRIWSAGCSTGEEPYTLAMVIDNYLGSRKSQVDVKILATDIDTTVLEAAHGGIYKEERMAGVPPEYRQAYFTQVQKNTYEVKESLRSYIRFGRFNLTHDFPFKRGFDVIFCRNVLIYFNTADRRALTQKFCSVLRPHGWLALGHSESLVTEGLPLETLGMTLYRMKD